VLVWGFLGVFDHTTVSFATWGCFLVDSQDLQPPLKGYKNSPMNGAGQPPASTFWRLPRSVKRSSLVAMSILLFWCAVVRLVAHSQGRSMERELGRQRLCDEYNTHATMLRSRPPRVVCGDSAACEQSGRPRSPVV
jgi:hypothetical protein